MGLSNLEFPTARRSSSNRLLRPLVLSLVFVGAVPGDARSPLDGEPAVVGARVFYGPRPGFENIDVDLVGRATVRVDMTAYVLSDARVIDALAAAARRGVRVRLYLDPEQNAGRANAADAKLGALLRTPNVEARIKSSAGDLMHLKSYAVDGRWLRSGSANFSFSGEARQDNDIVVLDSVELAGAYVRRFEEIWSRRDNARYAR
jgi:phosphatidylserine/phosphatidylglycerophosphate/cardiolipin synthase-like enzyme